MGDVVGCRTTGWLEGRRPKGYQAHGAKRGQGLRSLKPDLNPRNSKLAAARRKLRRMRLWPARSSGRAHARSCPRPVFRAPAGRVTSGGLIRKRR